MQIGILMAGHAPEPIRARHGDFDTMFKVLLGQQNLTFRAWDVENLDFPKTVHDADGWLISGSRHGVYEDHAFIPLLEGFIRDAIDADKPLVGICFGHQIIAQALGGKVVKFPKGWALGRQVYDTAAERKFALNAWHQDQVITRPDSAKLLAQNDFCENAALAYGNTALTFQAHPEFENTIIRDYVALRRGTGTYPDDRMEEANRRAGMAINAPDIGQAIATFYKSRKIHV